MLNPPLTTNHYLSCAEWTVLQLGSFCAGTWSPSECSAIRPATPSRRMDTRRGHSPLELGIEVLRLVSFRSGYWKPFWMLTGDSLKAASHASPPSLLPRPLPRFSVSCASLGYARHPHGACNTPASNGEMKILTSPAAIIARLLRWVLGWLCKGFV